MNQADRLVKSLLENHAFDPVSFHITGNYPLREVDPNDPEDHQLAWIVHFPSGHETMQVGVHGDNLTASDAIEAAVEFLTERNYFNGPPDEDGIRAVRARKTPAA